MTPETPQKVVIANRSDAGILLWVVKLYAFAAFVIALAIALTLIFTYRYFTHITPETPDLSTYAKVTPTVSRIYAGDGTLLGEFAEEFREVAPFEEIPEPMVDAFLAVEDHDFYDHHGIYLRGVIRAAWANITRGGFAQGGSTITQQVAKQFLGNEKSLTRKAKEAIMARRLEARYSKQAILSVYLNHIFLGGGAYGVKAAARRYFSKDLDELTLAEMAMIAGMAQAPSRYSPFRDIEVTTNRRNHVLEQMAVHGFITAQQAAEAEAEPIVLHPYHDVFPDVMPHVAEHTRRYIADKYGPDALLKMGLTVETTADPVVYALADNSVDYITHRQDKRQGWRGPEWFVEGIARDKFLERAAAMYGEGPLEPDRRYLGLVEEVERRGAVVTVGATRYRLPLDNMKWAHEWTDKNAINDLTISDARKALKEGDVIWVTKDDYGAVGQYKEWTMSGLNPRWYRPEDPDPPDLKPGELDTVELDQVPHPQSAIFTADHRTGYVLGMIGGYDYSRSQYNRTTQACRQPGSTYKTIYYSLALDQGYGYDSYFYDRPVVQAIDPVTGEEWKPKNFDGQVHENVSLEYALVFSKNVPSVVIFVKVGGDNVEQWARRLGFTTKIIPDRALALGASCTMLDELTQAYAVFARNGKMIPFQHVRRISDRDGNVVEDNTVYYDPMLSPADRIDRLAATAGVEPTQAIPARTAFLTSKLLRQTMKHGFASVVRETGIVAAGKTGTSSATMDTTFVGYTSRWITTVWLGDDLRVRPLGRKDAAYITVEPLWTRYMIQAAEGHANDEIPWEVPKGVNPRDRGDHSIGSHGSPMPLKYRKKRIEMSRDDG